MNWEERGGGEGRGGVVKCRPSRHCTVIVMEGLVYKFTYDTLHKRRFLLLIKSSFSGAFFLFFSTGVHTVTWEGINLFIDNLYRG